MFSSAGSMLRACQLRSRVRGLGLPMIEEKWLRATSLFHRVLLPNCSAFGCAVECAWSATTSHTEPLHRLSYKSRHTAKELKRWIKSTNSEARLKFHMANDVICRFDVA